MADEPQVIRGIDWKATFPFVGLFRAFRVAIHPSKLILGLAALILIFFGGRLMDGIWPASHRAVPEELTLYGLSHASVTPSTDFQTRREEVRKTIVAQHEARLTAIQKDPKTGSLSDIEWAYKDELNKKVSARRADFDKLPADKKTPQAELDRDNDINSYYAMTSGRLEEAQSIKGIGLFDTFCGFEVGLLNHMVGEVREGNWLSAGGVVDSIRAFFIYAPVWRLHYHPVFFTIFFLYFLCVWSIFGGAIARIAAVHVARDEKISIRQALRFSTSKFLSFLSAPIIPMLIVLVVGLVIAVGGLLTNIPFIGPIVVGVFFFLALIAGFVMTLVMLGTAGGFNLMYPTIAVEGSDSFDAISRSFSYLYARPWRMAFYSGVAILYGSVCYLFVRYFLYLMLSLTHKFVGLLIFRHADNGAQLWGTIWPSPSTVGRLTYDVNTLPLGSGQMIGAYLIMLWVYLAIGLLGAFAVSFYFSANTIIYFLMRHEVDATELDDVYLEQADDEFAEAPAMTVTTASITTSTITAETTAPISTPVSTDPVSNNGGSTNENTSGDSTSSDVPQS